MKVIAYRKVLLQRYVTKEDIGGRLEEQEQQRQQ